jgi:hypothetical protein
VWLDWEKLVRPGLWAGPRWPILLLVDMLSRKAWAYVLTKSKEEKRAEVNVSTLKKFKEEVGNINGLEGDNEFSSGPIKKKL